MEVHILIDVAGRARIIWVDDYSCAQNQTILEKVSKPYKELHKAIKTHSYQVREAREFPKGGWLVIADEYPVSTGKHWWQFWK
jgi:hypothetical protein